MAVLLIVVVTVSEEGLFFHFFFGAFEAFFWELEWGSSRRFQTNLMLTATVNCVGGGHDRYGLASEFIINAQEGDARRGLEMVLPVPPNALSART